MIFILVHFTKAPSDDRSIFIRSQPLKKDLSILDIPVMEDIELSYWMKKHGKVILLRESVVTSTEVFVQNGFLRQIWKIEYEEDGYRFFLFRGGPVSTSETIDAWQTTLSEKQEYLYNSLNECTFTIEAYSS
jgi:hypothetical protein